MTEPPRKSATQKGAEAKVEGFRQDLGPFVVAAETTRMAMLFTDAKAPGHPIIFVNDAFLTLSGYDRAEALAKPFNFILASDRDAEAEARLEAAFSESAGGDVEACCRRKDGDSFWAAVFISPVRDASGDIVQHFASFVDVTRHKKEAEHLHFLLDELNHRTQNTLATVQAIALQTLRGVADTGAVEDFEGRILALAKAHALLGRENWGVVSLRDILEQVLLPFGLHGREPQRFSVEGPVVGLPPKAALTLAMAFQELATNAAKHGALSKGDAGTIDITWFVEPGPDADRLRLQWRERGGPPVTPPSRRGFGSRLIEGGLSQELGGEATLDHQPGGLVCRMVLPLAGRKREEPSLSS